MRFNLRLTILSVVVLLAVASCAGIVATWTPSEGCDATNSLIVKHVPDPLAASIILQLANVELLKNDAYTAQQAIDVVEHIEGYLEFGITWADFIPAVVELVGKDYAVEVFVLSGYTTIFEQEIIPISDCDKTLIRAHLEKQKRVIGLYL